MEEFLSFLSTPVISTDLNECGIVGVNGKLYICDAMDSQETFFEGFTETLLPWPVISVSHTAHTTAVITCEGTVYVCGRIVTTYPDVDGSVTYPDWTALPFSEPVVSVQIGFRSMLILTLSGKVYGIGRNGDGHLGINGGSDNGLDYNGVNDFTLVELPSPCLQLKVRSTSTCAVTVDGSLYAWGYQNGKLGLCELIRSPIPLKVDIPGGELATSVEVVSSTLVLTEKGHLYNYTNSNPGQMMSLPGFCMDMRVTLYPKIPSIAQSYTKVTRLSRVIAVGWFGYLLAARIPRPDEPNTDYVMLDVV
ncbi:MAG: hypothetical protein WC208_13790 [Gallionella sp.]|jgi:alpha-tubulin suppressor-like RCC1 family protein